jgi:hypothetical protein
MKTITLTKVPGTPRVMTLEDGDNLGTALAIYRDSYGESIDGYELRHGDLKVDATFIPLDGQRIYLVQQIKGNA